MGKNLGVEERKIRSFVICIRHHILFGSNNSMRWAGRATRMRKRGNDDKMLVGIPAGNRYLRRSINRRSGCLRTGC
jgi:hypothetical protein